MSLKYIIRSYPKSFFDILKKEFKQKESEYKHNPTCPQSFINNVLTFYTFIPEYRSPIQQHIKEFVNKSGSCPFEWYSFVADSFPPEVINLRMSFFSYQEYTFNLDEYYVLLDGYYCYKSLLKLIEKRDSSKLLASLIFEASLWVLPILSELYHSPECDYKIKTKTVSVIIKSLPLLIDVLKTAINTNSYKDAALLTGSLMSIPEVMLYLKQHSELLVDIRNNMKQDRAKLFLSPFLTLTQEDSLNSVIVALNEIATSSPRTHKKSHLATLLAGFARTITSPDVFTELLFKLKYNPTCFFFNSPCIANLDTKTIDRALKYIDSLKTSSIINKPMFPVVTPPSDTYKAVSKYLSVYLQPQLILLMSQLTIVFNFTGYLNALKENTLWKDNSIDNIRNFFFL